MTEREESLNRTITGLVAQRSALRNALGAVMKMFEEDSYHGSSAWRIGLNQEQYDALVSTVERAMNAAIEGDFSTPGGG